MKRIRVAAVDEIPSGTCRVVTVDDKEIGVFNCDGAFYAARNICPHVYAPICKGRVTGRISSNGPHALQYDATPSVVVCPWHHWEFDLRTGQSLCDPKLKLKTYQTEVAEGDVFVCI